MRPSDELRQNVGPKRSSPRESSLRPGRIVNYVLIALVCLVFLVPFLWMIATALKPDQE